MNLTMSKPGLRRLFLLLTWCLFFAPFAPAQFSDLDKYGGAKALKCAKATRWFHTQEIGNRWWLCDPLGNVFFANMMSEVNPSATQAPYSTVVATKYGNNLVWATQTNYRLQSLGFNSL